VVFDGRVTNLEDALDHTIKEMQKLLNSLHLDSREMLEAGAATSSDDFKERVEFVDGVCDLISQLGHLVGDVPQMALEIQGKAPPDCKAWHAARKLARKTELTGKKAERKTSLERADTKLKAKLAVPSCGLGGESKVSEPLIAFNGQVCPPGEALNKAMFGIQRLMNDLHMEMRKLASLTEQVVDEDEDFKESVVFAERSADIVMEMVWLLDDLFDLIVGFVGKAPTECKAWHAAHKAERKAALAAEAAERKEAARKAKAELKAMVAAEEAEGKS
jgi:hypothetical protein